MKTKLHLLPIGLIFLWLPLSAWAQDEFDMSAFAAADDTEVKAFCNNKVVNLSPTKLVSISYDVMSRFDLETTGGQALEGDYQATTPVNINHGFRLDANFPIVSNRSFILNSTVRYWESHYQTGNGSEQHGLANRLNENPLRTAALGLLAFKPLDEKHFLIGQFEAALNGSFDFDQYQPQADKLKYSASLLYGWKLDDFTNLAIGVTRTYRGGRALHIPILLYNKTFNENWGLELLLPATGAVRRNLSTKSVLMLGYELEGQSYLLSGLDGSTAGRLPEAELRKSEFRIRLSWDKSLSDFIWFNIQGGVSSAYRFAVDENSSATRELFDSQLGLPLYMRIGFSLVSP